MILVEKKHRTKRLYVDYRRLNHDGIIVNPKNATSMAEWERPTTYIDVQSFLCLAECYHSCAKPMMKLTVNGPPFVWTDDYEASSRTLK